jgi:oligoribonuclease
MKYISIDLESSGKNKDKHQVLSIGAIIEDTKNKLPFDDIPKFKAIILYDEIIGEPRALEMNKEIISLIADYNEGDDEKKKLLKLSTGYEFYKKDEIIKEFYYFLYQNGFVDNENFTKDGHSIFKNGKLYPVINGTTKSITINVAGKNFGTFDKPFLENLPWWQKLIKVRQRLLDPSILYVDWENDETLPNLDGCKERANIKGLVTHDCLEDAWDVVLTLRNKY